MRDVIRRAIFTAQSARLLERNQYTFEVDPRATKPEIKSFVESAFKVKVVSVNTHRLPNKKTRLGGLVGQKSRHKRAIVTIGWGERIALFAESSVLR
uniref:ribosomal protein L23 n=1 Tax=Hormidiella parvula TaxID=2058785 RepID=UPI00286CDBE5|nr:ribosomal protein L23 [Hormidiella parvula]WKT06016.1 ribosomal protein L23 [Hormidiella parvula]